MRLGVNIDHVATIRQARRASEPEPVTAALLAELAGADGITVHLRGDRRHIQERDLHLLRQVVKTRLNVEMAATDEMVGVAADVKPDQVTLVPEHQSEVTTTGGLDVIQHHELVSKVVRRLKAERISVSLFIDPVLEQVASARSTGAAAVEINTGPYSDVASDGRHVEFERVQQAAREARDLGFEVLGGHGLTYVNVRPITKITEVVELNIGHSIVSRAVLVGLERAVREMLALLR